LVTLNRQFLFEETHYFTRNAINSIAFGKQPLFECIIVRTSSEGETS